DVQRVLARLDEAAFHAILYIGELDAAVADRTSAEGVKEVRVLAGFVSHLGAASGEQAGIAVEIGDHPNIRGNLCVSLDQSADGGREAGREAARGQHCNSLDGHAGPISGLFALVHSVLEKL